MEGLTTRQSGVFRRVSDELYPGHVELLISDAAPGRPIIISERELIKSSRTTPYEGVPTIRVKEVKKRVIHFLRVGSIGFVVDFPTEEDLLENSVWKKKLTNRFIEVVPKVLKLIGQAYYVLYKNTTDANGDIFMDVFAEMEKTDFSLFPDVAEIRKRMGMTSKKTPFLYMLDYSRIYWDKRRIDFKFAIRIPDSWESYENLLKMWKGKTCK
jgi:hypothetical protein